MVKMDILIGGDAVDALSIIVHRDFAATTDSKASGLQDARTHPRQMFEVAIQGRHRLQDSLARETVTAIRKNVIAKCYGGDISRKRKLLEKQKRRQKAHEADRQGRHPPGSLPRSPSK